MRQRITTNEMQSVQLQSASRLAAATREVFGHVRRAVKLHSAGDVQPCERVGFRPRPLRRLDEHFDITQHLLLLLRRERAQFFKNSFGNAHKRIVSRLRRVNCGSKSANIGCGWLTRRFRAATFSSPTHRLQYRPSDCSTPGGDGFHQKSNGPCQHRGRVREHAPRLLPDSFHNLLRRMGGTGCQPVPVGNLPTGTRGSRCQTRTSSARRSVLAPPPGW